ncbi:MAG: hypothetical protein QF535_01445, partial [Anaerolineales bacterium]|nr:hypothetical protein [Anaerolineales bacterium]
LCTDNLSDPSIADPTAHFSATTWTGDGSSSRAITTGVDADFVWYKDRTGTESNSLYDSIRGAQERLISNSTAMEITRSNGLQSFDSTGFTVGSDDECNNSSKNYVGFTWKAGGTASSNTDGDITSSVSANTDAGFSIISYAGNSSTATVGHGLSQGPEIIFVKSRSNTHSWSTGTTPIGWTERLEGLNNTNAAATNDAWDDTAPSSSVIYLTSDGSSNETGNDYICYAFHSVEGYSKVGSYTGNGSLDGAFFYTGFRPAWILFKSTASAQSWRMVDSERSPYNTTDAYLKASGSDAESSGMNTDFVSNGVKLRTTSGGVNNSETYIYLAFAESPLKYSRGR